MKIKHDRHGSALIVTLLVVVLVTVVVLAAFVKTQMSVQVSRSQMNAFAAERFAQDGVNQAIGLLRYATAPASDTTWATQPGKITRFTGTNREEVSLHSGLATSGGVNLNAPLLQNPLEGVVSYDPTNVMSLRWNYVRENGERTTSDAFNASNRIVGRYAFWVDDESARVNINTAWTKDIVVNTNVLSHPSRISLKSAFPGLTDEALNAVHQFRETQPFNSSLDILRALPIEDDGPDNTSLVRQAKFWTTHANSSPDAEKTPWGADKIVLTTKPEWAKDAAGNQLPYIELDSAKNPLATTRDRLTEFLSRSDWPGFPEKSLQGKYFPGDDRLIGQFAINIIEYVRGRESVELMVKPWRSPPTVGHPHNYEGPTRRFRMVEVGFWRNTSTPTKGAIYLVLHLPPNAGISTFPTADWMLRIRNAANVYKNYPLRIPTLQAGDYTLIAVPCEVPATGSSFSCAIIFQIPPADNFEFYPLSNILNISNRIAFPITDLPPATSGGTTPTNVGAIQTIKVADPWLGGAADDWSAPSGNRFADLSAATIRASNGLGAAPPNYELGQDLDENGHLTDLGAIVPPPAGTGWNTRGAVESLAELGRIHTGINVQGVPSVPFRTFRLQPRNPKATTHLDAVPDWVLMDIFTLPKIPGMAATTPLNPLSGAAGKMNLNSKIEPFSDVERSQAMNALFEGHASYVDESVRTNVIRNVMERTAAAGTHVEGKPGDGGVYRSIGELAEIQGISDNGEASEENLRQIIDLVSTQGNIFSVYAIGQSVIQSPDGTIRPRAESRQHFMVMRYSDTDGDHFKTIFNKSLGY